VTNWRCLTWYFNQTRQLEVNLNLRTSVKLDLGYGHLTPLLAWLSQSDSSQDRAQTQNSNIRYWSQFYCHCTIILSACETWNVSQAVTIKCSGDKIKWDIQCLNFKFEHDLDSIHFDGPRPGQTRPWHILKLCSEMTKYFNPHFLIYERENIITAYKMSLPGP